MKWESLSRSMCPLQKGTEGRAEFILILVSPPPWRKFFEGEQGMCGHLEITATWPESQTLPLD